VYQRALPHQGKPNSAGPTDSHPSWRPPAMAVLSEIDGQAQCYHEFLQAVPIHQCHKDGVNRGLAPGSRNTTISVFLPE
jgi:hypothetical protein